MEPLRTGTSYGILTPTPTPPPPPTRLGESAPALKKSSGAARIAREKFTSSRHESGEFLPSAGNEILRKKFFDYFKIK